MATAPIAKTEVGTIKVTFGDVKIIGVDGVVRTANVGDKVYAREVIQTAANAVVQVQLNNGRTIDMGSSAQLAMDGSAVGTSPGAPAATAPGDIASIQERIARGEDPTTILDPAGAGGAPGDGSDGGHSPVVVDQANSVGPVTSGYETAISPITFPEPQPETLGVAALPIVSVRVDVDIPNNSPPASGSAPIARDDVDFIAIGSSIARGNVVSGAGTSSGLAGADTPSFEFTSVTFVTSPTGSVAVISDGIITIQGRYGELVMNPDGSYTYTRNPGAPDGVVDTFTYTLRDASGDESTADLIIDIGTPEIPGEDPEGPNGDGAVVTVGGALLLEGTHPDAKEVNFVLTLDRPSADPVQVTYEIRPASASTPTDFFGTLIATVTFPPNTTTINVPVKIVQDHLVEGNEIFNIVLTNATNAVIDQEASTAQITIVDDDRPPVATDDTYDIVRGQPNQLPSVLTHRDPGEGAADEDTGAGPFETLTVVQPNGDPIGPGGFTITTAQGGTVVIQPDGTFTYTPPANLRGPDTFEYAMTDGFNGTDTATVTLNPRNDPPTVRFNVTPAEAQVNEAGLPVIGSDANSPSEITRGTFTISDPDGNADIALVTINGQPIPIANLPGSVITTPNGEMRIDSYDPTTGVVSFTYELKTPTTDVPNQPEQDLFTVTVTDNNKSVSDPAQLAIDIVDDVPTARNDTDAVTGFTPESGNVITGAGTTSGASGADTPGADTITLTGISSTNVPGNAPTPGPNGSFIIQGQYGALTINPDGSYTYTRNPGTPGGVVETFRYTLTDGDGDTAQANLVINIGDKPTELVVPQVGSPGTQVDEAGLPARPGEPAGSEEPTDNEKTNGVITFKAEDGPPTVTIDGVTITGTPGQQIQGDHGTLTVTGYTVDPVTGNGTLTYEYVLTDNTSGDTTIDDFPVVVTDRDGDRSEATLTIAIEDDTPIARDDADAVTGFTPESGNVISGAGTTSGAPGADMPGADNVALTNIASTNVPGNAPTTGPNGELTIQGQYGVLVINPDGSYTYTRNPGTPGGVVDTFRYTLTDGDGDTAPANLVINIGDKPTELVVPAVGSPGTQVDEAGLPTRPGETAGTEAPTDKEKTNGVITFKAEDGPPTLTIDGVTITGTPGQQIPGDHGTLTVTGYTVDPVTGNGTLTYEYLLTDNTSGDTTTDDFAVTVVDRDGDRSDATLTIAIEDDTPIARDDTDAVTGFAPESGNVITGAGTTSGAPGADTPGADNVALTNIASTNVPGNAPTQGPNGSLIIQGQYGALTINPDGSYTYTRNPGTPGGVVDTFRYTLTDGDGDTVQANLVINIGDKPVTLIVPQAGAPGTIVDEAGLPVRPGEPAGTEEPTDKEKTNGVITFKAEDGPPTVTIDGVTITGTPGQQIPGDHGTLTVTGFTYDPVTGDGTLTYKYVLADNTSGDNTVDDFAVAVVDRDGDRSDGVLTVQIIDDEPTISVVAVPPNALQVDETNLNQDATVDFGRLFTSVPGADDATVVYSLDVKTPGVASGLIDVASGLPIVLVENPVTGVIEGHVGDPNGAVAFTLSVNPATGEVTLDQLLALRHPDGTNPDDELSLGAADLVTLTGTITDGDGDVARAVLNLGDAISFKDDGPSISVDPSKAPALTVDETNLAVNATASFAGAFASSFGADNAGQIGYALSVGNPASGLKDVATGQDIILINNNGVIEGRVGSAAGQLAFTVSVNGAGEVTLDQIRALTHPNAANPDDAVTLPPGAIVLTATVTDRDGDTASAPLQIGGALTFKDDGPSIDPNNTPLPALTVDETDLATNATANFAANFTNSFGADGAGSIGYALNVGAVPTGLKDVATDADIVLVKNAAGVIEGRAGVGGPVAFTVTVAANGDVTLDQVRALKHVDATNPDDPISLAPGSLILTATSTDRDNDSDSANLNIGGALTFKDDGPNIDPNNTPLPSLTVDETDLTTNATANFAANFTNSFGADGAGSIGYALNIGAVPTGLKDVATDADIVLVKNAAGVIEGRAGVGGPVAFTVTVAANGDVTLDQIRAVKHPVTTNPDDPVSLAPGSLLLTATSTDRDGDADAANLNIGGALTFKDDGPRIVAGNVAGAVEEEALPVFGNQDTNDIPNTGLTASGSLAALASFGADGAGTFALDASAIATLTAQNLTSNGNALTYTITGDTLTARAAGVDIFTLQVTTAGNYTFTLKDQLDHASVQGENTLDVNFGALVKVTDRDGDSVSLGGNTGANFKITVQDDVPIPTQGTVVGVVDEDGLAGANADAGRTGEVAATGSATVTGAAGALFALASVGADQVGTFSFNADLSSLIAQNLKSNGVALTYSVAGDTLTAKAGTLDVFTLKVTGDGGYTFTLKDQLDHPTLNGVAGDNTENTLDINFGSVLRVTDRDGDTITLGGNTGAQFNIRVQDDIPVAADIARSTVLESGAVTNLTLVLDVSGSMATIVNVGGQTISRLTAEKQSAKALIDEYAALGAVKVTVVTFSSSASALGYWMDPATAKAAIDAIGGPAGTTNYTAGLNLAKLGYDGAHNGLLANAQDVLYFLSDGQPNPVDSGLDQPAEVAAWESFLGGSSANGNVLGEKITAFALGMGPDVTSGQLNPIAYNGVTSNDTNAIIVSDFSQLTQTLISTVTFQPVAGNLITDPNPDASYGADSVGWVQVLNVDGKTYVYDRTTDSTAGSTGTNGTFDTVENKWTITTTLGGKLVVDMDDGSYVYTPSASAQGSKVESIGFTLTDTDGDAASANLRINVEGPALIVGQNVNDRPGESTPHKVDPVPGTTGSIGGSGSNDILIGDVGGGNLLGKSANVIVMMDTSGSMSNSFGTNQPSRLQGLKDGVKEMLDALVTGGAVNVRVHLNHFGTTLKGAETYDLVVNGVVNTTNLNAAKSFVNNLTADGFTNYEASLNEALQWIDGPNELTGGNVINQAIFVSDGEPNTALTGNTNTPTSSGSLTTAQALDHIQGDGSGDTVSEIAGIESRFGEIQAIGMGLNATAVGVLSQVEGAGGSATNTTNAQEFKNVLANLGPNSTLGAVGNDIINGGAGNDIIYGDAVNTDALALARGVNLPPGSGWQVFETLEAGGSWTRSDTLDYIRTHQNELAAESVASGGAKRAGGNDTIDAGAGNDNVYGQEGNDIIIGGAGNDILSGGSGADTFKWNNADKGTGVSPATDSIQDFSVSTAPDSKDVLDLRDLLQGENAGNLSSYLSFSQTGADVTLSVHSAGAGGPVDQKIVLQGVTLAQLAGSNPADSAGVIANLLANNKLITD